jgi:hypothetical protein
MHFGFIADMVVLVHAAFVLFVVLGGVAALRWPRLAWLHIPAAVWGIVIEFGGCICPLTDLENLLRSMEGGGAYNVSFIEHYLVPVLYPLGLTRRSQVLFGLTALCINLAVYARLCCRRRSSSSAPGTG